ncbi:MAG TPA: hypothetical protein PKZ53_04820, partial [Acidobacteriota bacterium]|nr:hypothetical protein [Acidobacteriota bacterium]
TKTLDNLFSNKILAKESELRILVTDVLTAVAEHSHNRVLEQAYLQAQGLLVGTTTLTGALSDCLMKEISSLKIQILTYEERLAQFTFDFVGSRERNEAGQEVWTGGKYREAWNNLTTGVFAHTSFVDGPELERLYGELARYPAEQFLGIKTEIELKLGNDQMPLSIFHCLLERPEEVKRLVFELARRRFRAVQETSIAEKLETLPQSEVDRRIEEAFQRSHPLIRFDQNALFANDATTGTRLTHHNLKFHNIRKMATCRVQDDPLLVVSGVGESESKLAKAYRSKVTGTEPTQNLPDRYRIVFAQERGVFPLYCLSDLPEIRKAYVYEMRQEKARPRETNRKIVFPDLLPPDPRESGMPRRVKKALTLGKVFSLIQSGTDVQTEEPQVLYTYCDEQFTKHVIPLGGTFEEALQKLVKRQLDKEIHAQRPDEETHLEHLEGTLKREGQKPTTVTQKAKNWELMQTYLINLAHEIPGGEQNPVFQEERDFINEFRIEYGWKPPANWAPPAGDAVATSGTTPTEGIPSPTSGSDDEAAYRRRIRFMLGKKQGGLPSAEETERWIRQGVEDFHLSPAQAQAILSNEQQPKTSPSTDKLKLERYREECRITMEGGFLSSEGREILDDVRRRLGLTNDEAIQIEKEIMPEEKYRQTCREVIVNRTIPDDGQEILEDSRKRFQLNFERAQAILQAVLEEPLFRN